MRKTNIDKKRVYNQIMNIRLKVAFAGRTPYWIMLFEIKIILIDNNFITEEWT